MTPSISLGHDLKDQNGKIFYRANQKVNPLKIVSLSKVLIFINGDDEDQVNFAMEVFRKEPSKIILTSGSAINLMKKSKKRIYFDQRGVLIKKFNIKKLPTTVRQKGDLLQLREVAL